MSKVMTALSNVFLSDEELQEHIKAEIEILCHAYTRLTSCHVEVNFATEEVTGAEELPFDSDYYAVWVIRPNGQERQVAALDNLDEVSNFLRGMLEGAYDGREVFRQYMPKDRDGRLLV